MYTLKKILFEPLFHFAILAVVLFVVLDETQDSSPATQEKASKPLLIDKQHLKREYESHWNKKISDVALDALVQKKFYDELLLNEALTLNLIKEDREVQKRLILKMKQIVSADISDLELSEEELYKYYKKNRDDYSMKKNISFCHVFFKEVNFKDIEETLQTLKIASISAKDAKYFGDLFEKPSCVKRIDSTDLSKLYGKYFAFKLFNLKKGIWHKAIASKYGHHLVYIKEQIVDEIYEFEEVQDRVYKDYKYELAAQATRRAFLKFESKYKIEVKSR